MLGALADLPAVYMLDQLLRSRNISRFHAHDLGGPQRVDERIQLVGPGSHHVVYHAQRSHQFGACLLRQQSIFLRQNRNQKRAGSAIASGRQLARVIRAQHVKRAGNQDHGSG